jgi:hypothetical protein
MQLLLAAPLEYISVKSDMSTLPSYLSKPGLERLSPAKSYLKAPGPVLGDADSAINVGASHFAQPPPDTSIPRDRRRRQGVPHARSGDSRSAADNTETPQPLSLDFPVVFHYHVFG